MANSKKRLSVKKPIQVVKEPTVRYGGIIGSQGHKLTGSALSAVKIKRLSPSSPIEKMKLVKAGISKKYLEELKARTELDYVNLARLLAVTRATLINKKKEQKFNTSLSERIVGLADLYDYGLEIFEDQKKFNHWMISPNKALGAQRPFDLIDNQFGREEVRNILSRIEYGVYS